MQEGHKDQFFTIGANGVGLAFVKNQQGAGAKALFLAITAGKQPESFEDYDVDRRVRGCMLLNRLAGFESEAQNTAVSSTKRGSAYGLSSWKTQLSCKGMACMKYTPCG
jgi:hypothetical protein